jgi:hypothetical protein
MGDTAPADEGREWPLADMLGELGLELEKANRRVVESGTSGRLRWTEATIELGVTWEKRGEGGIDVKVVRLGGGVTKENTTTITIRVVPAESDPTPGPILVGPDDQSKVRPPAGPDTVGGRASASVPNSPVPRGPPVGGSPKGIT